MTKQKINIVWLKRDLRTQDHQPLYIAEEAESPYLIIHILDPKLIEHPDTSLKHLRFRYHSIKKMDKTLSAYGHQVHLYYGSSIDVLAITTWQVSLRMYNPVKQSRDHDPQVLFIKKWVPELSFVPREFIHEPWTLTRFEQEMYQIEIGKKYPFPIVDLEISGRRARKKIWGHRKDPLVQKEKQRILATHTRRKS